MTAKRYRGFDYRLQHPCERTRKEWQEDKARVLGAGGYQRHFGGDNLVFDKSGTLLFEVYSDDGRDAGERR